MGKVPRRLLAQKCRSQSIDVFCQSIIRPISDLFEYTYKHSSSVFYLNTI